MKNKYHGAKTAPSFRMFTAMNSTALAAANDTPGCLGGGDTATCLDANTNTLGANRNQT